MEVTSCFICGHQIVNKIGPGRWKKFVNLKQLFATLCDLLSVDEISAEDWHFLEELEQNRQLILCGKCYDLVRNVGRLQEIILQSQKQLKLDLEEVQKLVVRSEEDSQCLQSSLWNLTCFDFRTSVLNKVTGSYFEGDEEEEQFGGIGVKKECEEDGGSDMEQDNHFVNDDDSHLEDDNHWDTLQENQVTRGQAVVSKEDVSIKAECGYQLPECSVKITRLAGSPAKRPKLEEGRNRRGRSPRKAKERASMALREQSETPFERNAVGADSGAEDDPEYRQDKDGDEEEEDVAPVTTLLCGGYAPKVQPKKPLFNPFVVAKEDLYLYRCDTYVRKTYTHLECLAHECSFKTKFDYYPSFQRMKNHIEGNHRSRHHIRKVPHPCHLCNATFPKWKSFWEHIRADHDFILERNVSLQVCEGCLMYTPQRQARIHFFSHKNEEEKAHAIATQDGPARCIQKKESEMTEKPYACDHPDCSMAFKSKGNLRRHKQLHLPMELRSDQVLCPECGKQIHKDSLKAHMETIHHPEQVEKVLECHICNKKYLPRDRVQLEAHIRRHNGEKPFLCPQCGAAFVSNGALSSHNYSVHRDKIFPCQWCDMVFKKSGSYRGHVQRRHPDKYEKQPCKKKLSKFYYNEEDEVKGEVFGPVQMFPCQLCGTVVKFKCTLKRHMSSVHGIGENTRKSSSHTKKRSKNVEQEDPRLFVEKQEDALNPFPSSSTFTGTNSSTSF